MCASIKAGPRHGFYAALPGVVVVTNEKDFAGEAHKRDVLSQELCQSTHLLGSTSAGGMGVLRGADADK